MALKSYLLIFLAVVVMATTYAEAQGGLLGGILGLIHINGTVFCTLDGNIGLGGASTPVFPNALVQLQCGNNVVASTTTGTSGQFSFVLDALQNVLSTLLSDCKVVVKTPLSTCNVSLPSVGGLVSSLQFLQTTLLGFLNVANIIPGGFRFLPNS